MPVSPCVADYARLAPFRFSAKKEAVMSGIDDVTNKAKEFLSGDKAKEALNSEQAEGVSDKLLDGVAGLANKVTGGKFEDKIEDARQAADDKVGNE
jgi:hypothetical protein